ncbi:MAG: hypothetical protein E6X17_09745 [Sporomusaceae bacterium]|nr:hypothetical protein [Sporomusaceae bacterium]
MKKMYRYLAVIMLAALLTAGCAANKEAAPPQPQVGVLNMAKAIKAQPRYGELTKLQEERSSLLAQLSQQEQQTAAARQQAGLDLTNLQKAAEQEFQTKMAVRQDIANRRLQEQAQTLQRQMGEQLDAYVRELDASYQSNQFSLQVKLQTVNLSQEEQTAIQKQIDELKEERTRKINARQQELAAGMNETMKAAEKTVAAELDKDARQLRTELSAGLDTKARAMQQAASDATLNMPAAGDIRTKLEKNQQDLARLQQELVDGVKQQVAAVAAAQGLSVVIADAEIFTDAARDITDAVIAASK